MLQGPEAEEPDLPADRQLRTFRQGHLHLGAAQDPQVLDQPEHAIHHLHPIKKDELKVFPPPPHHFFFSIK